jgi:hypothetical protein
VVSTRIAEALGYTAGTQHFVDIVQRFALKDRQSELVTLAAAEGTSEQLAAAALGAAVELTARYVTDRMLPDKAIDVIDAAGARQKIAPEGEKQTTITVRVGRRPHDK